MRDGVKVGDVFTPEMLPELGSMPHKVTEIAADGRIAFTTYLWPYDPWISEAESQKRRALYEPQQDS